MACMLPEVGWRQTGKEETNDQNAGGRDSDFDTKLGEGHVGACIYPLPIWGRDVRVFSGENQEAQSDSELVQRVSAPL